VLHEPHAEVEGQEEHRHAAGGVSEGGPLVPAVQLERRQHGIPEHGFARPVHPARGVQLKTPGLIGSQRQIAGQTGDPVRAASCDVTAAVVVKLLTINKRKCQSCKTAFVTCIPQTVHL
jgi:hypothetical protein